MKSIKLLMATVMLAIGSTAAMAQASYTDKDGNEYQFKRDRKSTRLNSSHRGESRMPSSA